MKKLLSIFLAFTLLVTPALASQALGWELVRSESVVGPGVSVTTQKFWGDSKSDYRMEQFVTYTPGQGSSPTVAYGAAVPEKATLTAMAKALEGYGHRVLAGANGDYFVVATGVPLGMVVTWGVLRSSSSYHPAVGFDGDGNAIVGKPELTVWADFKGQHLAVMGGYNKTREAKGGLTLFSRDFGAAAKGTGEGVNVILRPVLLPEDYVAPVYQAPSLSAPSDPSLAVDPETGEAVIPTEEEMAAYQEALAAYEAALAEAQATYEAALSASAAGLSTAPAQLVIGGEKVACVVESVSVQSGGAAIPEGRFVLTAHKDSGEYFQTQLSALKAGELVSLSVTSPDPRWNNVQQAIGGYQLLLKDGVVQEGLDNTANPRTALGVKENGQVILYTIDGRRAGYSVGASMKQAAARLKELGCVDAVLFDGGGSTTFGATGAVDNSFTLQNKPSDGGQRAVSNALFFVSDLKATGELGSLYLTPQSGLFLPGGKVELSARGIDTNYHPMTGAVGEVSYTVAGPGTAVGNVFTAGAATEKTEAVVTGTAAGGQQGSTILTVVPTPHSITVADQASGQAVGGLNLDPGQRVDLSAAAVWYGLPMTADDSCFTWTVSPEVGVIDVAGGLTAGAKAAAGSVTVTAGAKSVSLPVTVAGHVVGMEDFEGGECQFRAAEGGTAALSQKRVKYGYQAMEILCQAPVTTLETYMGLNAGETDINFWVYPEGETALEVLFLLQDGSQTAIPVQVGAPGQWSHVQVNLPENVDAISGLRLTSAGNTAVYVDQISSTNGGILDETPPTVKITCTPEGAVTATLADNVDKTFDPALVSLTIDGRAVPFTLTGNTVTAKLELYDALLHRISLTLSDASGNLARASAELPPAVGNVSPFADVEGHWGRDYADYLYDRGISNGSPGPGGTLLFQPGANITRGDFVTMLMRWMGTDLSQYQGVELPFADAAVIQPWALDAVKAAYSLGIFTGSAEGDGLYANAGQTITRAQAMTLLGRVQAKGYAQAAQTFLDADAIPSWAAEHVSVLVGQGVVNGYGGYVRPNDPITRAEVAKVLAVMW